MRRLALVLALLIPTAAVAQAPLENCQERAFTLAACSDPANLDTCPVACLDPANPTPETCAVLPLPELLDPERQTPDQPILRQVDVTGGLYTGIVLTMITASAVDDLRFRTGRGLLCFEPAPPPVCPTTPTPVCPTTPSPTPPPAVSGPGLYLGGGPVWYGVTPRFR